MARGNKKLDATHDAALRGLAHALSAILAGASGSALAATEIAIRFYDDNAAARGASLSPTAHAVIERTAGTTLIAKGRDTDGAFRFSFASEPAPAELREALNNLRDTGALIYADIAADARSVRAKYYAPLRREPATSLIVRFKDEVVASEGGRLQTKARVAARAGVGFKQARSLADGSQVIALDATLSAGAVDALVAKLSTDPDVAHVEVDRRAQTQGTPSDPMFAAQWNLTDPVGGIAAPHAWDITTGDPNAPIAILDTGMLAHPDLAGRVIGGYDFVADARFSNDGDGRDADPTDPGDFVTSAESTTADGPLRSCAVSNSTWHGTMVAGTLGAAVNNGSGMTGVNWSSPLLNVRVMGKCGGALSDVADGIRWAAGLAVPGVPSNTGPARVINLSLAGVGDCGPILQSAVTAALDRGAVIVAAAGNDNGDVANHWPANCNGVIAVAATSRNGSRAFYSNSGSRISVSAPGGGIGGSIPVLRNAGTAAADPSGHGYGQQLGSSLAAPHVAGIASLVLAMNQRLTPAEVRSLIEKNARSFPAVTADPCSTPICGAGIVDAASTLSRLAPTEPQELQPQTRAPAPPSDTTPTPPPASAAPAPLPITTQPPATRSPPPPAVLAPFPGGWRAKTPAELERFLKGGQSDVRRSDTPALVQESP